MTDPLFDLISAVVGLLDLDDLIGGLLAALRSVFGSDYVSINDVGQGAGRMIAVIDPPQPADLYQLWGVYAFQNPLLARYMETQDGRAYRFSDVITQEDYHALELYREVYGPMGIEHQMAFTLPATPGRVLAVVLSRHDADYTDAERDLADRARPYLIQAWRNAIEHTALRDQLGTRPAGEEPPSAVVIDALCQRGVTQRQAEVVSMIAHGRSNRDAGAVLGISERTVQKHLEHAYATLGVADRSAVSALVWALVAPSAESPRRGLEGRPPA